LSKAAQLKARLAAKRLGRERESEQLIQQHENDIFDKEKEFLNAKEEIYSKCIQLELKILTVIKFDFDYEFATPFPYVQHFLHSNFDRIKE
jgi:hypothetical protein